MPISYKEANVYPVPKAGDLSKVSNYRQISLLNSEAKLFEILIFKYLFNHFRDNNLLSSFQSGFIPGDCTVNQLIGRLRKSGGQTIDINSLVLHKFF